MPGKTTLMVASIFPLTKWKKTCIKIYINSGWKLFVSSNASLHIIYAPHVIQCKIDWWGKWLKEFHSQNFSFAFHHPEKWIQNFLTVLAWAGSSQYTDSPEDWDKSTPPRSFSISLRQVDFPLAVSPTAIGAEQEPWLELRERNSIKIKIFTLDFLGTLCKVFFFIHWEKLEDH